MSADNGILIVRERDEYFVREYCASVEYEESGKMHLIGVKPTLEEAIKLGQEQGTEYGLSFSID